MQGHEVRWEASLGRLHSYTGATGNIMGRRAISRLGIGFYIGTVLWPCQTLIKYPCPVGQRVILTVAHMYQAAPRIKSVVMAGATYSMITRS